MSQQTQSVKPHHHSGWATGGTVFAGVLMMVSGVWMILEGISAIAKDDVWVRLGHYIFKWNLTAWGWIHLVLGVLVLIVGTALLSSAPGWARVAGIALIAFNILVNFAWLPYTPFWAFLMIAIDIFIIWALCRGWGDDHPDHHDHHPGDGHHGRDDKLGHPV
ncbi:hypothetical protein ACFYXS_28375 [Streptomyces sp. NPDC002574]|uniref:DUF7144 family membrane protein n=1 Tax=Streptomyces sp. NPDC002574 TaxID=3364652 RepID=UPI00369339D2